MKYDPMSEQPLKSARFKSLIHFATRAKSQSADSIESDDFEDVEFFVRPREEILIRHSDPRFDDVVVPIENVSCYVVGYTDRFPPMSPELRERIEQKLSLPWDDVTPGLEKVLESAASAPTGAQSSAHAAAMVAVEPSLALGATPASPPLTKQQRRAAAKLAKAAK